MAFKALRGEWFWLVIATVVFDLTYKTDSYTTPLCFEFERAGTISF